MNTAERLIHDYYVDCVLGTLGTQSLTLQEVLHEQRFDLPASYHLDDIEQRRVNERNEWLVRVATELVQKGTLGECSHGIFRAKK